MGFLGIGTWEILLILVLALIIMGPSKLTETARTLGKIVRAIKKASTDFTTVVTRELETTRSEPPASPSKDGEAPSVANKAGTLGQDNQPAKPGEASAKND